MAKRQQPESENRRKWLPSVKKVRAPSAGSLLFFWPFHLLFLITRPMGGMLRFGARLIGLPLVAALYGLLVLAVVYGFRARHYDLQKIHAMPERSIIHDRMGEEIGRIHGEKRLIIPLSQVAEDFRKAILSREDARFYSHGAMDPRGIGRALFNNLQGKREGASSITQQLTSDIFQLKAGESRHNWLRLLDRKLLEIAIGIRLETSLSKDEILEAYINQINWGRQIKGVGEASRIYFEKHPSELSLSQAAMLAGIVRGPDAFNPFRSLEAATRERNSTLDRMVDANAITRAQADAAKREPLKVRPPSRRETKESYALDAIREDLEVILEKHEIELGGLDITTTIDSRIQQKCESALEKRLHDIERMSGYHHPTRDAWRKLAEADRGEPNYLQGSVVVIENRTGAVLALVGGRDANESRFDRAIDAKRQLGSIFKPFVYLAAFDQGLRPDSQISDGPIAPGEIKGGGNWRPDNSDGKFGGVEAASYGLIRSRNTMSVRVGNFAGIPRVRDTAKMAGFSTPMPETPVSFLGSWEATPWEAATAYTIFPNEGTRYRPFLISQIKDRAGNILYSSVPLSYPAASKDSAATVSRVLSEVTTQGTAASVGRLGFDKPCAGKTGTTNDFKDAWFTGYTSSLTCAVWVGFDTPKKVFQGAYGATMALPVWVDIMKAADNLGYKATALHSKSAKISMELCHQSEKRATDGCREAGTNYIVQVPADAALPSNDYCPLHPARPKVVDESTGNSAAPLRARPIEEAPRRAVPVEEPPTRAIPVDEP